VKVEWKSLDSAPKEDKDGHPVPIVLFLPGVHYKTGEDGRPIGSVHHGRVIGWWDKKSSAWVYGIHNAAHVPGRHLAHVRPVHPSLWTELPDEPELPWEPGGQ
jgi:hypothetical protein